VNLLQKAFSFSAKTVLKTDRIFHECFMGFLGNTAGLSSMGSGARQRGRQH
jgi:hypothetical protein